MQQLDLVSVSEACEIVGLSETSVREWSKSGRFDFPARYLVGSHIRLSRSDLLAWLETRREER
ncbi:helix-turn-helix domain-containing protein [Corynebacterium casei]|uniref:helix-turn-helix domain-containing protein n=1 Tax=Corynebacterium casei TaxID=160386 RepID=UPI003BB4C473